MAVCEGPGHAGHVALVCDICGPAFNFPASLVVVCGIYIRICFDDFTFLDCVRFILVGDFKKVYLSALLCFIP